MQVRFSESVEELSVLLGFLVENINSAVFLVDEDFRIAKVNQAFSDLLGQTEERLLGQLCGNALGCSYAVDEAVDCGHTRNCGQCDLRKTLVKSLIDNVPSYRNIMHRVFIIKGERVEKYFVYSARQVILENKPYVAVIADDVTDFELNRLKLEKQNDELQKMMDLQNQLLGMAAHDLRNPIGAIQSVSALLNDSQLVLSREEEREMLTLIESTSKHSLNLINDILDYSAVESGRLTLKPEQISYNDLVNTGISRNRFFLENKKLRLERDIQPALPMLNVDAGKIHQVLDNLISNAVKFSMPGGIIRLKVYLQDTFLFTEVRDNGVGVKPEHVERLFTPFFTGSRPTAGEKSTGLGLSIVRRIVEGHGGKIGYRPNPEGGSIFWFSLPY